MIKDVYYFQLCSVVVTFQDIFDDYSRNYQRTEYILPNSNTPYYTEEHFINMYDGVLRKTSQTWVDLLEQRNKKQQQWRDEIKPGDTCICIITKDQEIDFRDDMKRLGLDSYCVYESIWAVNANYPGNGPNLKVFIYHIPKETNE